jgi:hydroxyversicolorone monooxygenase
MAPDISQMSPYTAEPANGYRIPDITFRDPKNRKLKVLTIGAGVSGT